MGNCNVEDDRALSHTAIHDKITGVKNLLGASWLHPHRRQMSEIMITMSIHDDLATIIVDTPGAVESRRR